MFSAYIIWMGTSLSEHLCASTSIYLRTWWTPTAQWRARCWAICIYKPETLFPTAFVTMLAVCQGTVDSCVVKPAKALQCYKVLLCIKCFLQWVKQEALSSDLSALCLTIRFSGSQQTYALVLWHVTLLYWQQKISVCLASASVTESQVTKCLPLLFFLFFFNS